MTAAILKKLVIRALQDLDGDWVIIGGTVLPLVGAEYRRTVDIDMLPMDEDSNEKTLALMELANKLDLPVEAINSSGLFFLKRIKAWQSRLVLHADSKHCRIFRPAFDLFLELKLARFSESDMSDIIAYLDWHQRSNIEINKTQAIEILKRFSGTKDIDMRKNLTVLRQKIRGI